MFKEENKNNADIQHEVDCDKFVYEYQGKQHVDTAQLTEHMLNEHHIIRVGEKDLMMYNGKRYEPISANDCKYLIKIHIPIHLRNSRTVNEVYFQLITELHIPLSLFNADENIINFDNGILHIDTGEMTPHSSEVYSSILIPCNYKAGLTFDDCPKFKEFIFKLTDNNIELIQILMEYIGAVISNVYGYRYKKMLILLGKGNTGKSVLRTLVMDIIGKQNCHSIDIKQLNSRFGPSQIINKRMAGSGDMTVKKLDDIEVIKQLTGADDLNADRKGIDAISFQYKGLLWFNTNRLPTFSGDKGVHVYERFIIVPCRNVIPIEQRNSLLDSELYEERDAIISIAVEALRHTIENGYKFSECKTTDKEREKYELSNNSLKLFIDEYCSLHEGITKRSSFNKYYIEWCNENGFIPEGKFNIGYYLEENYNITARKTDGNMCYDLSINWDKLGQIGQFFRGLDIANLSK